MSTNNTNIPNYNESEVSGKRWTRAVSMRVENPFNEVPFITVAEQDVLVVGDETVKRSNMELGRADIIQRFTDPTVEFDLLDPESGAVLGKATHADVRVILYSLYRDMAAKRDAKVIQDAADAKKRAEEMAEQVRLNEERRLQAEKDASEAAVKLAKQQQELADQARVAAEAEAARLADVAKQAAANTAAASAANQTATPSK